MLKMYANVNKENLVHTSLGNPALECHVNTEQHEYGNQTESYTVYYVLGLGKKQKFGKIFSWCVLVTHYMYLL